nr:hypothetical protein [uncultured Rhodopila sp.]
MPSIRSASGRPAAGGGGALPHRGVAADAVISLAEANTPKAIGFVPGRTERAGRGGQ